LQSTQFQLRVLGLQRACSHVREFRKRQKLGLMVRKVRINPGTVRKLIAVGYLEGEGDEQAEGIAIEAYLGDSL
jgi:hypothetical protein